MPTINNAFKSLEPIFQPIILQILTELESKGWRPIVAEGRRTVAQQQEKVKLGYSQTMNSYHLSGLAADVVDERYLWNIGLVHQFWWDLYQAALNATVQKGHLRCGIVWDHIERVKLYKDTLDDLKAKKISQKQADGRLNWFVDVAHIELRV